MPILTREPCVYPESLLSDVTEDESRETQWRVLHVKPRQEKALARELTRLQVPFYLPTSERKIRSAGRSFTTILPLFNGYLFLYSNDEGYYRTLSTRRVVRGLSVSNQARLWSELRQLQKLIESGLPIQPEERLLPGQLVEISHGPLAGLQGRILCSSSRKRFVVAVDFIGRGASVICDGMDLCAIPEQVSCTRTQ